MSEQMHADNPRHKRRGAIAGGNVCCSGKQGEVMRKQMQMAEPFIIGCPACMHNFRNLFCSLFCSPDQASFTNVTAAAMRSPKDDRSTKVVVVKKVSFYLTESFKNATFNSCKDVSFGASNSKAMMYIGNGAHTAQVRCSTETQQYIYLYAHIV